ncbi:MAG: hypothetical protein ACYC7H_11700, partial [Chloroflexota bacterium]
MKANRPLAFLLVVALFVPLLGTSVAAAQTTAAQPVPRTIRAEGNTDDGMGGGGPIWLEFLESGGPVKGGVAYKGRVSCEEVGTGQSGEGTITAPISISGTLTGNEIVGEGKLDSYSIDNAVCSRVAREGSLEGLTIAATVDFTAGT